MDCCDILSSDEESCRSPVLNQEAGCEDEMIGVALPVEPAAEVPAQEPDGEPLYDPFAEPLPTVHVNLMAVEQGFVQEDGRLAPLRPGCGEPKEAPPPLRSVVVDRLDVADSSDEEEGSLAGLAPKPAAKDAPTHQVKAAAKAETRDKKLSKEEMEAKVLDYMRQQNRPYNAQNVFDNLHGAVPKASVQTILDALCAGGKLEVKELGKMKVYLVAQTDLAVGGDEEMATAISKDMEKLKSLRVQVEKTKKTLSQLEAKHAAAREAKAAAKEAARLEAKAAALRAASGEERIDEREVLAIKDEFKKALGAWQKNKGICHNVLTTLGEGMGANFFALVELYGVDTDESCGHVMPPVFN